MQITEYDEATQLLQDNVFLQDGPGGTKKTKAYDLANRLLSLLSADEFASFIQMNKILQTKTISSGDRLLVGTSDGVRSVKLEMPETESDSPYFDFLDVFATPAIRANTFRGKNLGDRVTDEQWAAIKDGSFKGMFIGDYWLKDNKHWRIADFDYWYGVGGGYAIQPGHSEPIPIITDHHLLIFPDEHTTGGHMFASTEAMSGGILASDLFKGGGVGNQTGYAPISYNTLIKNIFPEDHMLWYADLISNAITDGRVSSSVWEPIRVCIPNTTAIYGVDIRATRSPGHDVSHTGSTVNRQFALLRINPKFIMPINNRNSYWLTDVVSYDRLAIAGAMGDPSVLYGTYEAYIRPMFGVK